MITRATWPPAWTGWDAFWTDVPMRETFARVSVLPRAPFYWVDPQAWAERRPTTVRQWFRTMRAAEFKRDLMEAVSRHGAGGVDILGPVGGLAGTHVGTLFEVQAVVDRETAIHYCPLLMATFRVRVDPNATRDVVQFVGYDGRVLGSLAVDWRRE